MHVCTCCMRQKVSFESSGQITFSFASCSEVYIQFMAPAYYNMRNALEAITSWKKKIWWLRNLLSYTSFSSWFIYVYVKNDN